MQMPAPTKRANSLESNGSFLWRLALVVMIATCSVCSVWVVASFVAKEDVESIQQLRPCNQSLNDKILVLEMIKLKDRYYYFSKIKRTWYQADVECRTRGMQLVSLHEPRHTQILVQYLVNQHLTKEHRTSFWTSGKEILSKKFNWTSLRHPVNAINWKYVRGDVTEIPVVTYDVTTPPSLENDVTSQAVIDGDVTQDPNLDHDVTTTVVSDVTSPPSLGDDVTTTPGFIGDVINDPNVGHEVTTTLSSDVIDPSKAPERCLEINGSGFVLRLKAVACSLRRRFVCEMPVICDYWLY